MSADRALAQAAAWSGAGWHGFRRTPAAVASSNGWARAIRWLVLTAFVAVSLWVPALHALQPARAGRGWTGAFGIFPVDQLQYMAWIRDAAHHVLVSNMFVLHPTPHDYLQPVVALSGLAVALGAATWVPLLASQLLAAVATLVAVSVFVRRQIEGWWGRIAAMALALLGGWIWMHPDMWLPFWSWGYPFGLLAVACAVLSLVSYASAREHRRLPWLAALLAALTSWLHPWQGEVLVLVVLGAEAVSWVQRSRSRVAGLLVLLAAGMLPLAYYVLLPVFDPSWRLARQAEMGYFSLSNLAPLAPLGLAAALVYRHRPRTFLSTATRAWPLAAILAAAAADRGLGSDPPHALIGITVPLAVLAVEGIASVRRPGPGSTRLRPPVAKAMRRGLRPAVAVAAVLAFTVPVTVKQLEGAASLVSRERGPRAGDQRALAYLATDPQPGGVLASAIIGGFIPAATGRHTYAGDGYWSRPNYQLRSDDSWLLLDWGEWNPGSAQAFVRRLDARFLLQDCASRASVAKIRRELGPLIGTVRRFGCAHVYTIT